MNLRSALEMSYPSASATPLCVFGAALHGPVGIPITLTAADVFTNVVTDIRTLTHGASSTDPLRFVPRGLVVPYRIVNGNRVAAFLPGLTIDGQTPRLLTPNGSALPFAQQTLEVHFTYSVQASPLLLEDQLDRATFPLTAIRVNGSHATATLACGTEDLVLLWLDGGVEANGIAVSVSDVGTRRLLEITGSQEGHPFTFLFQVGDGATPLYGTLGELTAAITASARLRRLPFVAFAETLSASAIVDVDTTTFSGGTDGLAADLSIAASAWHDALLATLGTDDGVFDPLIDLSSYEVVHVPFI